MLKIVGLGQTPLDITKNGQNALENADFVVVKSRHDTFLKDFDDSLDDEYEKSESYEEFNQKAAKKLDNLQKQYPCVALALQGDAVSDGLALLLSQKRNVEVIQGVGKARPPATSLLCISAFDLGEMFASPELLVYDIDSALTAGEVQLKLQKSYPDETEILFFSGRKKRKIKLFELGRQKQFSDCYIYIKKPNDIFKSRYGFDDLLKIMGLLTGEGGCPWDKEQTHESIRVNMIEESYEAVAAIESGNMENLIEELGDVMLQSIFHADIAKRSGEFDFSDVVDSLCKKLVSRHTHIFGGGKANDAMEALQSWEAAKQKEKAVSLEEQLKGYNDFPALLRAEKTLKKLDKKGKISSKRLAESFENRLKNSENTAQLLLELVAYSLSKGVSPEVELSKKIDEITK
jgi:tetrapyrrole methylase family protein/MazG family protein